MMDRVPYASLVGSSIFAMVCTRPDIAYSVGVLSRFMANPGKAHWEAAEWVLRYLRGTSGYSIYSKSSELMHAFLMQILPVISTKGGPLRVIYFGFGMVQLVGCQSFNRLMNVLGALSTPRPSIWR